MIIGPEKPHWGVVNQVTIIIIIIITIIIIIIIIVIVIVIVIINIIIIMSYDIWICFILSLWFFLSDYLFCLMLFYGWIFWWQI